jgi:hypothetical protein
MSDAVAAAPPAHARSAKDKEAKLEREREERERERQKAAAAAVKAQLAAQGNSRLAVETLHAEEEKKVTTLPVRTGSNAKTSVGEGNGTPAAAAASPAAPPPPPPPPVQPPPPPPPARVTSPRAGGASAEPPSPAAPPSRQDSASVPGTPQRAAALPAATPPAGTPPPPPQAVTPQSPQFNPADAGEAQAHVRIACWHQVSSQMCSGIPAQHAQVASPVVVCALPCSCLPFTWRPSAASTAERRQARHAHRSRCRGSQHTEAAGGPSGGACAARRGATARLS